VNSGVVAAIASLRLMEGRMKQFITTHAELAAAIRELYVDYGQMQVNPEHIARQLFQRCTFGRSLCGHSGKVTLASLHMVVAIFFERELEAQENRDDDMIEYAQDLLDSVRALVDVKFRPEDLKLLHPLDQARFGRLFQQEGNRALELLEEFRALVEAEPDADNTLTEITKTRRGHAVLDEAEAAR
jgi:hypothetical protein